MADKAGVDFAAYLHDVSDEDLRAEGDRRTVAFWYGPSAFEVLRKLELERDRLREYIDEAKLAAQVSGRVVGESLADFIREMAAGR